MKHVALMTAVLEVVALAAAGYGAVTTDTQPSTNVSGCIFLDSNRNGRRETDEKGMAGVEVSNGVEVTATGADGRYGLPIHAKESTFVFITTPAGYRCDRPFYRRITSTTEPTTADFGLTADPATAATSFCFAHITDIHIDGDDTVPSFRDDLAAIAAQTPNAAFLVATGDLVNVGRNKSYANYLKAVNGCRMKERFVHGIGNHDVPVALFERHLGPSYYAFNYGPVHFVLLNCREPDRTLRWLKNDLARQPKDKVIVAFQHYQPSGALLDFLAQYNTRALIHGHWHSNKSFYHGKILVVSTPSLRFGGIDCSARGYRQIAFDKGAIRTHYRWLGINDPPQPAPQADGNLFALRWQKAVGQMTGMAAPVAADGRVYLAVQDDDNVRDSGVVCLDARDGKRIWSANTDSSINGRVAVGDGTVCAVSVTGTVYGWQATTGRQRWSFSLGNAYNRWVYNSPVIADGRVYAGVAPFFVCLELATGRKIWQAPSLGKDWISCRSTPAVDESKVYLNANCGQGLTALARRNGSIAWNRKEGFVVTHSSPAVRDQILYQAADATLYALDTNSKTTIWSAQLSGGWTVSSPVVKGSQLVIGSPDGKVLALHKETGAAIWSYQTGPAIGSFSPYVRDGSQVMATPVIAEDKVYIGANDGTFYVLDLATGKPLWRCRTGLPIVSAPAVVGDRVYVARCDGMVYAFDKSTTTPEEKAQTK